MFAPGYAACLLSYKKFSNLFLLFVIWLGGNKAKKNRLPGEAAY
jgi:hypothetical protein